MISNRLTEARTNAGLSQAQAGKLLGYPRQRIYEWEQGQYVPGSETLAKLAELYDVSLDWLVTGKTGAMPPGLDLSKLSPPDAAAITRLVGTLSRITTEDETK